MSLRDRFRRIAPAATDADLAEARAARALTGSRGQLAVSAAPRANRPIANLVRTLIPKGAMGIEELRHRWAEYVGAPFDAMCTPMKLSRGVLVLAVASARALAVSHNEGVIKERLMTNAGIDIKSIRLEQRTAPVRMPSNVRPLKRALSPAEEAALAQALDPVSDPGLKSALLRLGRAVRQG